MGRRFKTCICERYHFPLLDHRAVWVDREGRRVFTAEPYGIDTDELADFTRETEALGLRVRVSDRSAWYPGRTKLLVVTSP